MIVVEDILIGRQMLVFNRIFHVFIYVKPWKREQSNQLAYETQWAIQLVGEKKNEEKM